MGVGPVTSASGGGVVPAASTTVAGKVELATSAEALAGTDLERVITPAALQAVIDSLAIGGSVDVAVYPDGGPWPARSADHMIWISADPTAPNPANYEGSTDVLVVPAVDAYIVPFSDLETAITTGTSKMVFFFPFDLTLYGLPVLNFATGPTGSGATVDVNVDGSTILSTKLTVDAGDTSSVDAATPAVLSTTSIGAHARGTIDVDAIGTGAKGGTVTFYYMAAT